MTIKKKLVFYLIVFLVVPIAYAAEISTYGDGLYGANLYGIGEVTLEPTPETPSGAGGGGGGGKSEAPTCVYDWQCTGWFPTECPASGTQERICINRGTCIATEGLPGIKRDCVYEYKEPLFDIFLTLLDEHKEICSGEKIKANVRLENYGKIELLDAYMTYWVINENNKLIVELKDTRAITNEKEFEVELKIPEKTSEGDYRVYAQINYNQNKTAVAGETFEILSENKCNLLSKKIPYLKYLIYVIIAILIIFILIIIFKSRSKRKDKEPEKKKSSIEYKNKIKENLRKIRPKHFLVLLSVLILIRILSSTGNNITGQTISDSLLNVSGGNIVWFILIVSILGFVLFGYGKTIIENLEIKRMNKYPSNSVRGLIEKKVYTENGDYIGLIEEVFIRENKIAGFGIELDKKQEFKVKKVVVRYEYTRSIGHVVIIEDILNNLRKIS